MAKEDANETTATEEQPVNGAANAPEAGEASGSDTAANSEGAAEGTVNKQKDVLEERAQMDTAQKVLTPPPAAPQVDPEEETMTIVLSTTFKTNRVEYGPGEVTLPKSVAQDLIRREAYHQKVEAFRHDGRDYSVKEAVGVLDAAGK